MVREGLDNRKMTPVALESRAKFLLKILLEYAYKLLTFELTLSVPPDLAFNEETTGIYLPPSGFPDEIKGLIDEELYCTVLYNDETHTFDTVINTLTRALECTQRDAVDYATMIDREGRCVVKIDHFQVWLENREQLFFSRYGGFF